MASIYPGLPQFGSGELEAISLAHLLKADILLIDDEKAKLAATQTARLSASGTVGILYEAAINDLIKFTAKDFDLSIQPLRGTNFRFGRNLHEAISALSIKLHSHHAAAHYTVSKP